MIRTSFVIALALISGCADPSVKPDKNQAIQTTVSGGHVNDVSRDIQGWHDLQHPDCPYKRVVAAQIAARKSDSVVEHWTVEACKNQHFTYRALIMSHAGGGIGVSVSNVDGSPGKSTEP